MKFVSFELLLRELILFIKFVPKRFKSESKRPGGISKARRFSNKISSNDKSTLIIGPILGGEFEGVLYISLNEFPPKLLLNCFTK